MMAVHGGGVGSSQRPMGSVNAITPCSTRSRVAAAVNCLLTDASWNRVPGPQGSPAWWFRVGQVPFVPLGQPGNDLEISRVAPFHGLSLLSCSPFFSSSRLRLAHPWGVPGSPGNASVAPTTCASLEWRRSCTVPKTMGNSRPAKLLSGQPGCCVITRIFPCCAVRTTL